MKMALFHDLPSGGAKRALYEQVSGLSRRGHRIDAFLPATADETFLPLDGVANTVTIFPIASPPARERMLEGRPRPLDALRWIRHMRRVRKVARTIADAINCGGYDVVLVHPSQFTQAPYVLRWLRPPSLYYCQESLRAAYEDRVASPPLRFLIRNTLGRIDRHNLLVADSVAVNSRFSAGAITTIYGRVPTIVRLGVAVDRFQRLAIEREDFIMTVAALHPLKGLDFLIDAVSHVPAPLRPPLLIVSDRAREAERRRLELKATALDVDLRFRFRVTDEELVTLYNRSRLVVYTPYREPFGLVPLEAMACGRPVLGVRDGGIPETIQEGETGFLEDRDPARFGARIEALLNDRDRTEAVGARAAVLVREQWNWERAVVELEAFCIETMERPRPMQEDART